MIRATALLALVTLLSACNRSRDDVREWEPVDHDQPAAAAQQRQPQPQPGGAAQHGGSAMAGLDQTALTTWSQRCVPCHGRVGRGDGPQGAQVGARDLSNPAWQASTTDEQIRAAIVKGHGAMPAFQVPPATVTGLVGLIRMMRAGGPTAPVAAGSAAPSASAPPTPSASAAPRSAAP